MKFSKSILFGLSCLAVLVTACQVEAPYEKISGIDQSKARPLNVTLDEDNISSTGISVYWDGTAAVQEGALSFTAQLVTEYGGAGDNYNTNLSITTAAKDDVGNIVDAASFNKLSKGDRYYVRVRANYGYSVWSDWSYLCKNDEPVIYAVGLGYVYGEFSEPKELSAKALTYGTIQASWAVVGPAEGYEVSHKEAKDADWTVDEETTETTLKIKGLEQLSSYSVRVRAYRDIVIDEENNVTEREWTEYAVIEGIETPEKPDFSPEIKDAEQFQRFIEEIAAQSGATDEYKLMNDIDLADIVIGSAENFAGKLDGQGFKIKNLILNGTSLFVASEGEISNVVLDTSCKFSDPSGQWGALVAVNKGKVYNCTNNADVTISAYGGESEIGGLVGRNTGLVEKCTNNGSIIFTGSDAGSHSAIGGVVGLIAGTADKVMVKDCVNNGTIFLNNSAKAPITHVGGVVGATPQAQFKEAAPQDYGVIENCTNNGDVTHKWGVSDSGSYCNVGGVAGYIEGSIRNCKNFGNISVLSPESNAAASTRPSIAGVAGAVLYDVINCTNKGTILIKGCYAAGTQGNRAAMGCHQPCFAGVVGAVGGDVKFNPVEEGVVSGNVNEGTVDTQAIQKTGGGTQYYAGGVFGYVNTEITDCHNRGELKFAHGSKTQRMGGVVGTTYKNITACTNEAPLSFNGKAGESGRNTTDMAAYQNYIGGIVGMPLKAITIKDCTNSGPVTFVNGWASAVLNYVGGINGSYTGGNTMENCHNKADITVTSSEGCCLCVGGVSGAFNGTLTGCTSESAIKVSTGTPAAGKEHEVGGLVGYTNASAYNCTVKGSIVNDVAGTFTGGLLGGFGEADKQVEGCAIDVAISGAATAGSILGQFRKESVHTLYYKDMTISEGLASMPLCGNPRKSTLVEGTAPAN